MDNKKLLKLVLVLCASAFIAFSCSKKNTPSKPNLPSAPESSSTTEVAETTDSSSIPELSSSDIELSSTPEVQLPPKPHSSKNISSIGELRANSSGTIMNFHNDGNIANAKSAIITVSGFSDSFKQAVQNKTDIKYVIRKITVTSVSSPFSTKEEVQRSIKDNAILIVNPSKYNEIQVVLAGDKLKAERNARDIASAINTGRAAYITLLVEAFSRGNTAGKFYSSTFEVKLIMQVLV